MSDAQTARPASAHLTDVGNAERFALEHRDWVRYCWESKTWLLWEGTHWQQDPGSGAMRLAKATARAIYEQAAAERDETRRQKLAAWAVASESEKRLRAMLSLAQSEAGIAVRPAELDSDPWLLNCLNGTLELRTCELRQHRREDLITRVIPVAYDPAAECPIWRAFLDRVFASRDGLIRFMQRALGYCLTGLTSEQCLFILWGVGDNGKSTLIDAIMRLLASYAAQMAADTLLLGRDNSTALNDLSTLQGARFVAAVESDMGRRLAEALVKTITGDKTLKVKRLYADLFTITPTFKCWVATNHRPQIRGTDHAIWRRIRLVPFDVSIPKPEQDQFLAEKLAAEAAGILAWAVEGCRAWQRDGLGVPLEVDQATTAYRQEMDSIGEFIAEQCVLEPIAQVGVTPLYSAYTDWAAKAGEPPMTRKALSALLAERGLDRGKSRASGHELRVWLGIRLRCPLDDEPGPGETGETGQDAFSCKVPYGDALGDFIGKQRLITSQASQDPPGWVTESAAEPEPSSDSGAPDDE